MSFSIRKRIYSILFTLVLCLVGAAGWLVLQIQDLDNLKGLVGKELETLTHREVEIGWADLKWADGIGLQLNQVVLHDPENSKPLFSADRVDVTIGLVPLLQSRVELEQVRLEGASLQVTRYPDGKMVVEGLGTTYTLSQAQEPAGDSKTRWDSMRRLDLKNGSLVFVDRLPDGKVAMKLTARKVNASLSKPRLQPAMLYTLSGELIGDSSSTAEFQLHGKMRPGSGTANPDPEVEGRLLLRNGHLPWFRHYLDRAFAFPPKEKWISAEIDFSRTPTGLVHATGRMGLTRRAITSEPTLSSLPPKSDSEIMVDLTLQPDQLRFNQLTYRAADFKFSLKGGYSGWKKDNSKVSFDVTSTSFPVQDSRSLLPFMLFHEKTHEAFHSRFKQGKLEIRALKFDGTLDQLNHLSQPSNLKRVHADLRLFGMDFGPRLPELEEVQGGLKLDSGMSEVSITKAHYSGVSISNLSGKMEDILVNPQVDWTIKGRFNLAQLKKTLSRLLDTRSFEEQINLFQDLKGGGDAVLHMQGPIRQPDRLALEGSLQLENASFRQPDLDQPFENVKGQIRFTNRPDDPLLQAEGEALPWQVKFEGFSGKWGGHEISELAAETTLEKGSPIRRVYGKVRLGLLEAAELAGGPNLGKVRDFVRDLTFSGGEVFIDFRGEGTSLTLNSEGPRGLVQLKKVTLKHKAGFRPLINVSGFLYFDKDKIRFDTTEAWYGDSPIKIKGQYLNTHTSNPELVLRASSSEFKTSDFEQIPFLETLAYDGSAKVEFIWQSNNEYRKFENHVDLTEAAYRYGDILTKPAGASNIIMAKGRVLPEGGLKLEEMSYELDGNRITGNAKVERPSEPRFVAHFESKKWDTFKSAPFIHTLASSRSGTIQFSLDGKGHVKQLEKAFYQGTASLKDLSFKPEGFAKAFTLNADLKWRGKQFQISKGRLESDKTRTRFSGEYSAEDAPKLKLTLQGKSLHLNELLPDPGESHHELKPGWWRTTRLLSHGSGEIDVKLSDFQYQFWNLKDVVSKATFNDRKVKLEQLTIGQERKNRIQAQGTVDLSDPVRTGFDALIMARHIEAKGFFDVFGPLFKDSLSGQLNWFKAKLKSRGANLKEVFANLEGDAAVDLAKGRLQTARLRDGVKGLFGIPGSIKPDELKTMPKPYVDILGEFKVKKGIARTENFLYENPERRMSLVGDFNLGTFKMDTVIGVAPLRELDKFLTKIPLVGRIITAGDEESLFKNYYTVEGDFSNPEINPIPFTSLGKKVVGIFQGILQTPTHLFPPAEFDGN